MKELNEKTAGKMLHPERVIQFGEGNFLRAFVDWIIQKMNENVNFNSSVRGGPAHRPGNGRHVERTGLLVPCQSSRDWNKGEKVNKPYPDRVISRALNPYADFSAFMKLAEQPEIRFVISNTTEAGITFDRLASWRTRLPLPIRAS